MTMPFVPTDQQLIDFVVRESRLLDQQRLEDWLNLFTEDGHYWMPVEWGQTDPKLTTSLMYEDKLLLRIRVDRLKGKATYSQSPKSRCRGAGSGRALRLGAQRRDELSDSLWHLHLPWAHAQPSTEYRSPFTYSAMTGVKSFTLGQ